MTMVDFQQQSTRAAVHKQYHMNGQNHRWIIIWLIAIEAEYHSIERVY